MDDSTDEGAVHFSPKQTIISTNRRYSNSDDKGKNTIIESNGARPSTKMSSVASPHMRSCKTVGGEDGTCRLHSSYDEKRAAKFQFLATTLHSGSPEATETK